jgi:hypothetical protein
MVFLHARSAIGYQKSYLDSWLSNTLVWFVIFKHSTSYFQTCKFHYWFSKLIVWILVFDHVRSLSLPHFFPVSDPISSSRLGRSGIRNLFNRNSESSRWRRGRSAPLQRRCRSRRRRLHPGRRFRVRNGGKRIRRSPVESALEGSSNCDGHWSPNWHWDQVGLLNASLTFA